MYNHVRQELFVAEETTQNSVNIPTDHELVTLQKSSEILKTLHKMIDSPSTTKDLGVQMENIELLAEQGGQAGDDDDEHSPDSRWKRRKVIPMPRITEDAADLV